MRNNIGAKGHLLHVISLSIIRRIIMYTIDDLFTLMARLRDPNDGCPWDQVQTYQSIAPSTLEEAYEVVDAIEQGDKQQLREELGDLLFQVVFYSELGKEEEIFNFKEIVSDLVEKLIRRHPHVFPEGTLESRISPNISNNERMAAEEKIKASWEAIKKQERDEKGHQSILDDIPATFPASLRAVKLQKRAASVGFDWESDEGVYEKLDEELSELREAQLCGDKKAIEDEMGDLLFTVINLSRHLKIDPETALRKSNHKFEQRFRIMEAQAAVEKREFSALDKEELQNRWEMAKKERQNRI